MKKPKVVENHFVQSNQGSEHTNAILRTYKINTGDSKQDLSAKDREILERLGKQIASYRIAGLGADGIIQLLGALGIWMVENDIHTLDRPEN